MIAVILNRKGKPAAGYIPISIRARPFEMGAHEEIGCLIFQVPPMIPMKLSPFLKKVVVFIEMSIRTGDITEVEIFLCLGRVSLVSLGRRKIRRPCGSWSSRWFGGLGGRQRDRGSGLGFLSWRGSGLRRKTTTRQNDRNN